MTVAGINPGTALSGPFGGPPLKSGGLLSIVEAITIVFAACAVFGYLSLRSHLNTIGVTDFGSLGLDRYLAELAELVFQIILWILISGIVLVLISMLALALYSVLRRFRLQQRASISTAAWPVAFRSFTGSIEAPLLMSALVMLLGWAMLMALRSGDIGLAVGELSKKVTPASQTTFLPPVFLLLLGCGVLLCRACLRSAVQQKSRYSRLWFFPLGIVIISALQWPILYGRTMHNSEYVKAKVEMVQKSGATEREPICGLLVLETNSSLHLWQVFNGVGQIRVIPKSGVGHLITGESDSIWKLVDRAKAKKEPISLCPVAVGDQR
jgi:hypothetical protein